MADSMNVTGNASNIDISRWKKLSAQEILKRAKARKFLPKLLVGQSKWQHLPKFLMM